MARGTGSWSSLVVIGLVAVASTVGQGLLLVGGLSYVAPLVGPEAHEWLGRNGGYLALSAVAAQLLLPVGAHFAATAVRRTRRRALGGPLLTLAGLVNVLGLWGSAFGLGMLVNFPLLLWVAGFGGVACAAVSTVPRLSGMSPLLLVVFACTPSAPPQATGASKVVVTAATGDTGQYVEPCTTESFDDVVPPGAPARAVAIDDVTGQLWVAGEAGVFEVVNGVGVPQPAPGFEGGYYTEVAASAGRLVVTDGTHDLWWRDAGGTLQKAEHGRTFEGISGAGGVFFAVGAPTTYGDSYGAGAELWRHDGTGWVQLPKGPLRDYAAASAVWADSPDSAWVGLRDDQGEGAVARNDGGSWAMVLTELEGWVSFVGASAAGGLWVPLFDGPVGPSRVLMVDDGVATELVGAPDNPRGAADMSDGSVFVTAFSGGPYDTSLHRMSPDGTWSIEAQSGKLPRIAQRDADELWVLLEGRHLWHRVCP